MTNNTSPWRHRLDLLKAAMLEGTLLDPQQRHWMAIANQIASDVQKEDRLRYWTEIGEFVQGPLMAKNPHLKVPLGVILFRRAEIELRNPLGFKTGLDLLKDAIADDEQFKIHGPFSTASLWYAVLEKLRPEDIDHLDESERDYLLQAVGYATNRALSGALPDNRVEPMLEKISSLLPYQKREFYKVAGRRTYSELQYCAALHQPISALACAGYLAEWLGINILFYHQIFQIGTGKDKKEVELATLKPLAREVSRKDKSENRIVGSTLTFLHAFRNRIHPGEDFQRGASLDGIHAPFFLHLIDRIVIQTGQWLKV